MLFVEDNTKFEFDTVDTWLSGRIVIVTRLHTHISCNVYINTRYCPTSSGAGVDVGIPDGTSIGKAG